MASVQNGLESFESEGRNWMPAAPTSNPTTGLHVYNSLSREKVPFVTRDGSKQVTWYICGPTVYDSSHLGHARNYVTFDIIRRIMEGYFGYDILYVMNVTDVDDKIINRARRNYLLDRFRATATNPGQVTVEFEEAYAIEHLKQTKQVEGTRAIREHQRARSWRQVDEKVKEKLKEMIRDAKGRIEQLLSGGTAVILASHLDLNGTASVTGQVTIEFEEAYAREHVKQGKQVEVTIREHQSARSWRQVDEIGDKVKEEELKLQKIEEAKGRIEKLLSVGIADILASHLDLKDTASVTGQVTIEFEEAYAREHVKQGKQLEVTIPEHQRARSWSQVDEIGDNVKEQDLELQKIQVANWGIEKPKRNACSLGGKEGGEEPLSGCITDILASYLDVKGEASLRGQAIRSWEKAFARGLLKLREQVEGRVQEHEWARLWRQFIEMGDNVIEMDSKVDKIQKASWSIQERKWNVCALGGKESREELLSWYIAAILASCLDMKGKVSVTCQVTVEFEEASAREYVKQRKQVEVTIGEHEWARLWGQVDEIANKVKEEELKLQKIEEAKERFEKLKKEACDLGGKEGVEKLLSGGIADILASHLDVKGKASVTDHAIFRSHAARYECEFMEDMKSLGVQVPDVLTRVTEYIDKIIEYVQVILNHELAYVANNSVYFDTKAFRDAGHTYGKLNPWAVGSSELASESESNFETTEKRSSCDFALWKKSKEGEPAWKSPWGMGRPGWHIECSAMASDILGDCMDIHSGGHDLQFPHHDNELAQAEAYFNSSEWVKYFFHSGHLSIDGLKMSKSLKNFITIKEALQKYTSRQLRMLFAIHAWDKPINFSEAAVNKAVGKEKQFKNFFSNVQVEMRQAALEDVQRWPDDEKQLQRRIQEVQSKVRVRLEDNFDTAGAVSELLLLVKDVHSYIDKCNSMRVKPRIFIIHEAAVYITKILSIFGLSDAGRGDIGFGSSASQGVASAASLEVVVAPYLDAFALFRDQVRTVAREGAPKEKLLEITDRVRDETMVDLGVRFEDKGGKSTWKLDDPEVLQREREEKIQKDKEKLLQKEVARRELEERKQKAREEKLQRKQQQKAGQKNLDSQDMAGVSIKELSKRMGE